MCVSKITYIIYYIVLIYNILKKIPNDYQDFQLVLQTAVSIGPTQYIDYKTVDSIYLLHKLLFYRGEDNIMENMNFLYLLYWIKSQMQTLLEIWQVLNIYIYISFSMKHFNLCISFLFLSLNDSRTINSFNVQLIKLTCYE